MDLAYNQLGNKEQRETFLLREKHFLININVKKSIAGLGFGFGLGHRILYYADTMGKGSESESESVETCSA